MNLGILREPKPEVYVDGAGEGVGPGGRAVPPGGLRGSGTEIFTRMSKSKEETA